MSISLIKNVNLNVYYLFMETTHYIHLCKDYVQELRWPILTYFQRITIKLGNFEKLPGQEFLLKGILMSTYLKVGLILKCAEEAVAC